MINRAIDTQNKLSAKLEKDAQEKLEKEMAKVQAENESSKVQVASIETQSTSNISEEKPTQSTDEVFFVEVKMQLKLDKKTYEHLVKNGNSVLIPNIEKCFKTYIQNSCSFKKI
jgi:mannose-6-phosphate isomerase-like protein (cupin superfamily)